LQALDIKTPAIDYIDTNNPNTIVPLVVPNNTITHPSNHVIPAAYDNPIFINQSAIIITDDDDENMTIRKTYF
jgi:hypothetical protein